MIAERTRKRTKGRRVVDTPRPGIYHGIYSMVDPLCIRNATRSKREVLPGPPEDTKRCVVVDTIPLRGRPLVDPCGDSIYHRAARQDGAHAPVVDTGRYLEQYCAHRGRRGSCSTSLGLPYEREHHIVRRVYQYLPPKSWHVGATNQERAQEAKTCGRMRARACRERSISMERQTQAERDAAHRKEMQEKRHMCKKSRGRPSWV